MKKKTLVAIFALLIAVLSAPSFAIIFDFTTVNDIVKSVKKRYGEMQSYYAEFKITTDKGGKRTYQQGQIRSKFPDKMKVEFSQPSGQRIVTNGNSMWIYIPSMNVVAEQNLKTSDGGASFFSSGTRSGLERLFSKYHFKFDSKDQPSAGSDGKKYYTLFLRQKESRSGYRSLKLWITEDFLIVRAQGETASGKKVEIEFNNIRANENYPNGIFKIDFPANARVIKNPMMAEE